MSYVELSYVSFDICLFACLLACFHVSFVYFCLFTCYVDGMFQSKFPFKDNKVLSYIHDVKKYELKNIHDVIKDDLKRKQLIFVLLSMPVNSL